MKATGSISGGGELFYVDGDTAPLGRFRFRYLAE
jgi:hypothetical protein